MKINQKTIRELYYYEPFQGILYKHSRKSRTPIRARYTKIRIDGKDYMFSVSTVIYMYVKGFYCPYVMRKDKDFTNNKWFNFYVNPVTEQSLTETEIPYVKTPPI